MASLRERLELSADPIAARRLIESEQRRPTRRGRRRVLARLLPPGSEPYERWLERNGYAGIDRQE
jgi:hypothetical protein